MGLEQIVKKTALLINSLIISGQLLFGQTDKLPTTSSNAHNFSISNNKIVASLSWTYDSTKTRCWVSGIELLDFNDENNLLFSKQRNNYKGFQISSNGKTLFFDDDGSINSVSLETGNETILYIEPFANMCYIRDVSDSNLTKKTLDSVDYFWPPELLHVHKKTGNVYFLRKKKSDYDNWQLCSYKKDSSLVNILFESNDSLIPSDNFVLSENGSYFLFQKQIHSFHKTSSGTNKSHYSYIVDLRTPSDWKLISKNDYRLNKSYMLLGDVSKDGDVVFLDKPDNQKVPNIYLMKNDASKAQRVSPKRWYCSQPVISDDGKYVAFNAHKRNKLGSMNIYVLEVASGKIKKIDRRVGIQTVKFSPDASVLSYSANHRKQNVFYCVDNPFINNICKKNMQF
jgi:hypothetical protein